MAIPADLLADAEAKYHALMTGRAIVELRDQNGETVRYSQARKGDLKLYVEELRALVNGTGTGSGPMRIWIA